MTFESKIISGFLSDQEMQIIEKNVMDTTPPWQNWSQGPVDRQLMSTYHNWDFYDPKLRVTYEIMWPKILQHFGNIYIGQIHIFDNIGPYWIHTDIQSGIEEYPAWTFIIPLDTYNSHTVVFNEGCDIKDAHSYIRSRERYDPPKISDQIYEKYFSHMPRDMLDYFSIESIFKWEKGSLFAADRWKFHTSDNYLANGITNKRALVAWTNTQGPTKTKSAI